MPKIDDRVREQVAADYAAGMLLYDISCKHGISSATISKIVREKGLKLRGRGCPKGIKHNVVYRNA